MHACLFVLKKTKERERSPQTVDVGDFGDMESTKEGVKRAKLIS